MSAPKGPFDSQQPMEMWGQPPRPLPPGIGPSAQGPEPYASAPAYGLPPAWGGAVRAQTTPQRSYVGSVVLLLLLVGGVIAGGVYVMLSNNAKSSVKAEGKDPAAERDEMLRAAEERARLQEEHLRQVEQQGIATMNALMDAAVQRKADLDAAAAARAAVQARLRASLQPTQKRVVLSELEVRGGTLSEGEVETRLQEHLQAFQLCFHTMSLRDPTAKGRVHATFRVCESHGKGVVRQSRGEGTNGARDCVSVYLRRLEFSSPGAACTDASVSIDFDPSR